MALIKDRKPALDSWLLLDTGSGSASALIPEGGDIIVPLSVWRDSRTKLVARSAGHARLGVWLSGDDEPAEIAQDLDHFKVIAVSFTSFTDGRGYSIGRLLRERYGWRGELRAIGDVQRDQLYYLLRCGFDAFSLRDGEDVEGALGAFNDFSVAYQTAVDQPLPLFRRREAAGSLR